MSNPFPYGQCTWWAAQECPWVLRCTHLGNARDWAANWRADGGFIGLTPALGTIACFQPGSNGADAIYGHVAVVVQVLASPATVGEFIVSEMNGPAGPGRTDDRTCHNDAGASFLYDNDPTPPEDDDMPKLGQFIAKTTTGGLAYFISDGMHFRHVLNPNDEAGVMATGPWFNNGTPLRLWNPQPVADIAAFGVPANKETADLLGLVFP